MVSDSFVQYAVWEMFSLSKFESILSHAKCLNKQGTNLDGINVLKSGSILSKYYPAIAKTKGKVYATKIYYYLLMTRPEFAQLCAYFLCHDYVPVFYLKSSFHSWQIQHCYKSGGWLTCLRQYKTSISISMCHCRETQLQLEQLECLCSQNTLTALW